MTFQPKPPRGSLACHTSCAEVDPNERFEPICIRCEPIPNCGTNRPIKRLGKKETREQARTQSVRKAMGNAIRSSTDLGRPAVSMHHLLVSSSSHVAARDGFGWARKNASCEALKSESTATRILSRVSALLQRRSSMRTLFPTVLCFALVTPVAIASGPAQAGDPTDPSYQPNTRFHGPTLKGFSRAEPSDCMAECKRNEGECKGWTWYKEIKKCYLWKEIEFSRTEASNCCISGLLSTPKGPEPLRLFAPTEGTDIYDAPGGEGNVIGVFRAGNGAPLLDVAPDGWCKLDLPADQDSNFAGGPGWVWLETCRQAL
jgi:PAN domain